MQPNHAFDPFLLEGLSVLVVEDALPVAKAMKGLLEQYKIDVVGPVATADDARRQLAIRRPQAALVDINLEGEPAWGLIDDLWDEQVDVIVSSGDPQLADTTRASMIHLQKPYDAAELLSALCAIAQKSRSNIDRRSRVD